MRASELERGGNFFCNFKIKARNLSVFEKIVLVSGRTQQNARENSPRESANLARMLERRDVCRVVAPAAECDAAVALLERRGRRCDDHIKMRLKEVQWGAAHWIYLVEEGDRYWLL